jgi:putative transposase
MSRKHLFTTNGTYHIYNRGVEKRKIFIDYQDYQRFFFLIDRVNTKSNIKNTSERLKNKVKGSMKPIRRSEPLVKVFTQCCMPNHYHLVVQQLVDGGVSKFLQKLNVGYTMYFNKKYDRNGVLFQGKTKSKLIDSNSYYNTVTRYIVSNPLELKKSSKYKKLKDSDFLKQYKWLHTSETYLFDKSLRHFFSMDENELRVF